VNRLSTALLLLLLAGVSVWLLGCQEPRPSNPTPSRPAKASAPDKTAAEEGEVLDDSWQAAYLHGANLGYGHAVVRQVTGSKGDVVRTTVTQVLRMQRYGQTTEETLDMTAEDTPEGQPLTFRCRAATMGLESKGEVANGMLKISTTTKGKTSISSIPWDDGTLGYFGLEDSLRRQPMQAGDKRRVKWLQPLLHLVTDEQLEAEEEEQVDLLGEKKQLLRIKSVGKMAGQTIRRTLWTDKQGRVWKLINPESGEESYRTTEQLAKQQKGKAFDLGTSTIAKVTRELENPHETKRILYRVKLTHRNPAEVFASCPSQSIKPVDEHTVELTVRRVMPTEPETLEPQPEPPTPADTAPNNLIQSDDARVQKLATEIAADETDSAKIAFALERAVRERVTNKNFSTAFATAAEVAQSLSGDCTEHAVLLAALCRARKIPARVVAGLVYVDERPEEKRPRGYAYHMWTEAWLGDRWVPLDATLGRGGIGAAHLKLSDSNLEGVSALSVLLPVMNVLGQLEVEVLEVE
jgi:hypothetical protein